MTAASFHNVLTAFLFDTFAIFICGKKLKGTFVYGSLFDTIGQLFEEDVDNEKSIIDVLKCN